MLRRLASAAAPVINAERLFIIIAFALQCLEKIR